jgi:hypothetical protein
MGNLMLVWLLLLTLGFAVTLIVIIATKGELKEAKHIAITWWFLPELANLENGVLELERSSSDPLKWEAGDNFFEKLKAIREMDIRNKTIRELKELMEDLRDLRHEARLELS